MEPFFGERKRTLIAGLELFEAVCLEGENPIAERKKLIWREFLFRTLFFHTAFRAFDRPKVSFSTSRKGSEGILDLKTTLSLFQRPNQRI